MQVKQNSGSPAWIRAATAAISAGIGGASAPVSLGSVDRPADEVALVGQAVEELGQLLLDLEGDHFTAGRLLRTRHHDLGRRRNPAEQCRGNQRADSIPGSSNEERQADLGTGLPTVELESRLQPALSPFATGVKTA